MKPFRAWTLRRTLVTGASVLVALAFLVAGITTATTLRSAVLERLDQQVLQGLEFAGGPVRQPVGAPEESF
ncbi:hypothetical protein FV288_23710, partial [Escherichia coli]